MTEEKDGDVQHYKEQLRKANFQTERLNEILTSLFQGIENTILVVRIILYLGSVLMSWFYLKDRTLAVGITCALSIAHALILLREYVQRKKHLLQKPE